MKLKTTAIALMLAAIPGVTLAQGQAEEPIITIHTNIYKTAGAENDFVIRLGMTADDYIDIDGGFGMVEQPVSQATFDSETQTIKASVVSTRVSADGVVKIYGDASKIDYLDVEGTYITSIEMSRLTNLEILNMDHNELGSLDLTPFTKLQSISLSDNPFNVSPLVVGPGKPELMILTLDIVGDMSSDFNLSDYPSLMSFSAWANKGLRRLDPTGCPSLRRISIDGTDVASIDLSKNADLQVLNISDTRITSIDLSHCPKLGEFYAQHMSGTVNSGYKLADVDLSHCPLIYYLYLSGNDMKSLDVTALPNLMMLSADHNRLSSIDLTKNANLYEVNISYNDLDFTTLPINPGSWGSYICTQNPLPVALSYPVGGTIDMSSRVLRQGYTTTARLFVQDSYNLNAISELDDSYYSFKDGVLTLNKAVNDSVYVNFYNDAFDDCTLSTTKFMVKTADTWGKPSQVVALTGDFATDKPIDLYLAVSGASATEPRRVYVDCGDGNPVAVDITDATLPSEPNVKLPVNGRAAKRLLVDDGVYITGLGCHKTLYDANVSSLSSLRDLDLSGAGLYSIDLTKNNLLKSLDMSDNMLSSINLAGTNGGLNKINLNTINLAGNRLTAFEVPDNRTLVNLDLSRNALTSLSFRDADNLERLKVASNNLTELDVNYCAGLKLLDASSNSLSTLVLPAETSNLELNIAGNNFTFANLPRPATVAKDRYTYAPQRPIGLPTMGPGANLSAQCVDIDGNTTLFTWQLADGTTATEGVDYTIDNGRTRFVNTNMGKVTCLMTNAGMPDLTLTTTPIEAAGMPTNLLAEFTTPVGDEAVELSLAADGNNPALYIDWSGRDDLEQYLLKDSYTLFDATTVEGARVKVYTYSPLEKITVFSVSDATMADADFSKMTDLKALTVRNAGLPSIKLPANKSLRELILDGNELSQIDLTPFTNLFSLSLTGNKLTTFDFSPFKQLNLASVANNLLTEVKLDNPEMWLLNLAGNSLSEVNLAGVPAIEQLSVSNNLFETIDVSMLSKLTLLHLDNNRFNFSTLPLPKKSYYQYVYSNQAAVTPVITDGNVADLSFNKQSADGVETVYRWFIDRPVIDTEAGTIDGEELYINDEYTIDGGVTTFLGKFTNLVCVMTNATFEKMYMTSTPISVEPAGLNAVEASQVTVTAAAGTITVESPTADINVALFDIKGSCLGRTVTTGGRAVFSGLPSGVYLLVTEAGTYKVALH